MAMSWDKGANGNIVFRVATLVVYAGGFGLVAFVAFRLFMWFFYDRHEGRRVNKRLLHRDRQV